MKRRMFFLALVTVMLWGGLLHAANTAVSIDGQIYTLRTNSPGGHCTVTVLGGGEGIDVDCDDGAGNRAVGNIVRGCLLATGSGQCFSGPPPVHPHAETDVDCNGTTYEVTTGNDNGTCTNSFDSSNNSSGATCDDGDGNSSGVDCSKNGGSGGCTGSTGSGDCSIKKD